MNAIIKVNEDTQMMSARELHESLKIATRFNDWFPRMCEYGFEEGEDFYSKMSKSTTGGRPQTDYDISMDMAKQICMIQRTPEGKQVRQYLIDLEKAWNTPEQVMARALRIANQTIDSLHDKVAGLQQDNARMKPKEIFADAVSTSKSSILIGDLAKLICQNGVEVGQKRLFNWMRANGYLLSNGSSRNMPAQRYMEQGLFEVKESTVLNPDGSQRITRTTKVTGKGQVYFVNKFLEKAV
jgi:anti-repressor protein